MLTLKTDYAQAPVSLDIEILSKVLRYFLQYAHPKYRDPVALKAVIDMNEILCTADELESARIVQMQEEGEDGNDRSAKTARGKGKDAEAGEQEAEGSKETLEGKHEAISGGPGAT